MRILSNEDVFYINLLMITYALNRYFVDQKKEKMLLNKHFTLQNKQQIN